MQVTSKQEIKSVPLTVVRLRRSRRRRSRRRVAGRRGRGPGGGASRGTSRSAILERRPDRSKLDVGERDSRVGRVRLDVRGHTRASRARPTRHTGVRRRQVRRVLRVQPEHVCCVVVPDRQHKYNTARERLAHLLQSTLVREQVRVGERRLLLRAELVRDRVERGVDSGDVDFAVLDHDTVLDVETADLRERAGGRVVVGQELGDDRERLGGVDGHACTVERGVAHAERVEVAASRVTETGGSTSALVARARIEADGAAGVGRVGGSHGVGLPDVHLAAAGTHVAGTRVGRVRVASPSSDVGLEKM